MGIINSIKELFDHSVNKKFKEFIEEGNNREALIMWLNGYQLQRGIDLDDKKKFDEYETEKRKINNERKSLFKTTIDKLDFLQKKYINDHTENIKTLYEIYTKYYTLHREICSLYKLIGVSDPSETLLDYTCLTYLQELKLKKYTADIKKDEENIKKIINKIVEEARINSLKNQVTCQKSYANVIIDYLKNNNVTCFYHFTDQNNLQSIRQHHGLYSWMYCKDHNIYVPNPGGDDQSRNLDIKYNLQDFVRLSFCDDHPMAYRKHKEGSTLVLLQIKIDVAAFVDTQFSDVNAADSSHSHGGELTDLQRVKIQATKCHHLSKLDSFFKPHQAECMVKTFIPIEYIINIDNPPVMSFQ